MQGKLDPCLEAANMPPVYLPMIKEQSWQSVGRWLAHAEGVERDKRMILSVTSPLTRFLQRRYGVRVSLLLEDQFVEDCSLPEAQLLTIDVSRCLRRQVRLMWRQQEVLKAESILPIGAVSVDLMASLQQGEALLANLLVDHGLSLARSELKIAHLEQDGRDYWARRSVLRSGSGASALVTEVFHPDFWSILARR